MCTKAVIHKGLLITRIMCLLCQNKVRGGSMATTNTFTAAPSSHIRGMTEALQQPSYSTTECE